MRITLPDFLFERAFTFFGKFCIMKNGSCTTGCGSVWLERTAGGREVAGSNPVTPIDHKLDTLASVFFCSILKKAIIGWRNIPASAIIGRRGKQGRQGEVRWNKGKKYLLPTFIFRSLQDLSCMCWSLHICSKKGI